MSNSRALLHGLGLVALSSVGQWSCGGDVGIIVTVENWPSSSPYLLVDTLVNGTPGQQFRVPAGQTRFVVRLPGGQTGDLTLSAFAIDDLGCKVSRGELSSTLSAGLRHTGEGSLTLSKLEPALCKLSVRINAGTGSVASTPAGFSCSGLLCEGEFPKNTNIHLEPTPGNHKQYSAWSGSCTGNSSCDVALSRSTEIPLAFMPRKCTPEGWCFHHPTDASGNPIYEVNSTLYWPSIDSQGSVWFFGNAGEVLRCNSNSCKRISYTIPSGATPKWTVAINENIWATVATPKPALIKCSNDSCKISYDFMANDTCKSLVPTGQLFSGAPYLITTAQSSGGTVNSVIRISTNEADQIRCEKIWDTGTAAIKSSYASGNIFWLVTDANVLEKLDCSSLPCTTTTASNIPGTFSYQFLLGNSKSAWLGSNQYPPETILMRCSVAGAKCIPISVPYKTTDYIQALIVGENSSWIIGRNSSSTVGTDIIYVTDAGSVIKIDNANSLYNFYAGWGNDTDLWMGVDTYIRHCNAKGCETITPGSGASSGSGNTYVYSIGGRGKDVWAGGYSGPVLHYQQP